MRGRKGCFGGPSEHACGSLPGASQFAHYLFAAYERIPFPRLNIGLSPPDTRHVLLAQIEAVRFDEIDELFVWDHHRRGLPVAIEYDFFFPMPPLRSCG